MEAGVDSWYSQDGSASVALIFVGLPVGPTHRVVLPRADEFTIPRTIPIFTALVLENAKREVNVAFSLLGW